MMLEEIFTIQLDKKAKKVPLQHSAYTEVVYRLKSVGAFKAHF